MTVPVQCNSIHERNKMKSIADVRHAQAPQVNNK